jgi:hypothetical protein
MRELRALGAWALVFVAGCASAGRGPGMAAPNRGAGGPGVGAPSSMQPPPYSGNSGSGMEGSQGVAPGSGGMPLAAAGSVYGEDGPIGPDRPMGLRRPDPNSSRFGSRVALASWEAQRANFEETLPMLPVALMAAPHPDSPLEDRAATLVSGPAPEPEEPASPEALPPSRRAVIGGEQTLARSDAGEARPAPASPRRAALPVALEAPAPADSASEAAPPTRRRAVLPVALEAEAQQTPEAPPSRNTVAALPGPAEAAPEDIGAIDSPPRAALLPVASEPVTAPAAELGGAVPSLLELPVQPFALGQANRASGLVSARAFAAIPGPFEAEPDAHASNSSRAFPPPPPAAEADEPGPDDRDRVAPRPRLVSPRRRPAPLAASAPAPAEGDASQAPPPPPGSPGSPFGSNPPPLRQPRWQRLFRFWRPDAS